MENLFKQNSQYYSDSENSLAFLPNFEDGDNASSANLEMIRRLENVATFGQATIHGANQIIRILQEIQEFMKDIKMNPSKIALPDSVIQNFIDTRLNKIRSIIGNTQYKGKSILSGEYSPKVIIEGKKLRFVKAMSNLKAEKITRLPVQIYRAATQSHLIGEATINDEILKNETAITLVEGSRFLRYRLKENENTVSLLKNLQEVIENHGFGVTVTVNKEQRLVFIHNQFGSNYTISALSESTNLISRIPGDLKSCELGLDIQGSIGDEKFIGNGKFLIGTVKSSFVSGLIIHFNGVVSFTGETVGHLTINPNSSSHAFNDGFVDYYCVPSLMPENLSVGVENKSNISCLAEIKGSSLQSVSDSLLLIQWAIEDIELFLGKIKSWENKVIEQSLALLRDFMISPKKEFETLLISKTKAEEMSLILQKKLSSKKPLVAI